MKFLNHDLVRNKPQEHAARNSGTQRQVKRKYQRLVNDKKQHHPKRGAAEVHVIGFERRAHGCVMLQVPQRQKISRQMKQVAVVKIFECVCPEKAGSESDHPFLGPRRKIRLQKERWYCPGQNRRRRIPEFAGASASEGLWVRFSRGRKQEIPRHVANVSQYGTPEGTRGVALNKVQTSLTLIGNPLSRSAG